MGQLEVPALNKEHCEFTFNIPLLSEAFGISPLQLHFLVPTTGHVHMSIVCTLHIQVS